MSATSDDAPPVALRRGRSAAPPPPVPPPRASTAADTSAPKKLSASAQMAVVRRELKRLASQEPYYACSTWRREPYDVTPYEVLRDGEYVAGVGVENAQRDALFDRLRTSVEDGWTDFVPASVNASAVSPASDGGGGEAMTNGQQLAPKAHCRLELDLSSEKLNAPLRLGVDVEERPLWGMDCFTREAIFASISVVEHYAGDENKERRLEFLRRWFLPKLHESGEDGWDMFLVAERVLADAEGRGDEHVAAACRALLRSIVDNDDRLEMVNPASSKKKKASKKAKKEDVVEAPTSDPEGNAPDEIKEEEPVDPRTQRISFRLHPKGTGVVCVNPNGLKAGTFVNYYIGEIYQPWKWYERQDAIKKCFPDMELPSFFNITLERPPHDERGRHVIFVEAMHKGCFASRLSHSCEPNCQTVTFAKDGRLALGMFTTRDIACGEEMTWDYSCITESIEEYRTGFCLCSSPGCRGSFLTYSGSGAFTAVMNKKHAFLHRNAVLFNACASPLEDSDRKRLHDAGFRDCALDNCPDWIVKWAALTLDYVKMEEEILPQELMSLPPTAYGSYNELGAKFEAIGVASTRFTNLVVTLDKVRYVLNQSGQKRAPVFQVLTENEIIDHLWSGEQSIFRRFLGGMMSVGGSKRKRANETSEAFAANTGDARVDAALRAIHGKLNLDARPTSASQAREWFLAARAILLELDGTFHAQASDCLWFYANTHHFFTFERLDMVVSPPVDIDDMQRVFGVSQRTHIPNAFHGKAALMLRKKYSPLYIWGQLVTWFKQTIYTPEASLSADRRGALSLPDPEGCYSATPSHYVKTERRSMIKLIRKNIHAMWPSTLSWNFKNPSKVYGSPMFDEALRETYPRRYAAKKEFKHLLAELEG